MRFTGIYYRQHWYNAYSIRPIQYPNPRAMDEEDMKTVVTALETTSTALDLFTSVAGFAGGMAMLGPVVGPLLMVTAQLLPLFLAKESPEGQESPELKEIKNVYNQMNTRFDQMSDMLDGVSREIAWSRTHIPFGEIERTIRSNIRALNELYESGPFVRSHYKAEFLKRYDRSYADAGGKLYDALVNSNHVFESNIPQAVIKYTKNHRQKLRTFMVGIIKLLYDCYKLEMTYLQLKNMSIAVMNESIAVRNDTIESWTERMMTVFSKTLDYDRRVEYTFRSQSEEDFDDLAMTKVDLNNEDFCSHVNNFLVAKYPWRRWFVVVYDTMVGSVANRFRGFARSEFHGRNAIVVSKSKAEKKRMNYDDAKSAVIRMKDTYMYKKKTWWKTVNKRYYYMNARRASDENLYILNSVPNYAIFGVTKNNHKWYTSPGAAISSRKKFDFFLMG